jgi:hypothetical protein
MVCMLDEHFLVHTAVHRPILKLLKICVGDELEETLDGRGRVMGAASISQKSKPSQYEEDRESSHKKLFTFCSELLPVVDLLCTLCRRIRTYHDLLMIFFYDKRWFRPPSPTDEYKSDDDDSEEQNLKRDPPREDKTFISNSMMDSEQPTLHEAKPEYEFIIFNYLLRFVHREGRIGDFARAGMLFLIDVAMESPDSPGGKPNSTGTLRSLTEPAAEAASALADYILEGDFAEVLSAGVAAVYSLLPSKLRLVPANVRNPASGLVISMDDQPTLGSEEPTRGISTGFSNSQEFCCKVDHFLTILEFIQDVLKHDRRDHRVARNADEYSLTNSVLFALRKVFLDNILYPSILESSESDGSSVAILSYLEACFRTLAPGPLVRFLLDYLLSEGDETDKKAHISDDRPTPSKPPPKATKMRRRKSSAMILLEMEVPAAQSGPDYIKSFGRFTLKDLINSNIGSENAQAATAALQLLQTLMHLHCEIAIGHVVVVSLLANGSPVWWHDADSGGLEGPKENESPEQCLVYERAVSMYRRLAERDEDPLDIAFSTSYAHYVEDNISELLHQRCYRDQHGVQLHMHCLRPGDPILRTVVGSLCRFFLHTPQQNLALTGLLVKLALCPHRALNGWLVNEMGEEENLAKHQGEEGWHSNQQRGEMRPACQPIVYRIFQELFSGLNVQRMVIDDFDRLLQERRQGLLFSENLQDAIQIPLDVEQAKGDREAMVTGGEKGTPTKKGRGSFLSFLTPTKRTPAKVKQEGAEASVGGKGRAGERTMAGSNPFKEHYEETRGMRTEAPVAELEDEDGWIGRREEGRWGGGEEDVFGVSGVWEDGYEAGRGGGRVSEVGGRSGERRVSELLDNVVILEECVKELAAAIEARGCLGA